METLEKIRAVGYGVPPSAKDKRTLTRFFKEGKKVFSPERIIESMERRENPYSESYRYLDLRDKALVSLVSISCCRINEALRVRKSQIDLSRNDFALITNFIVSKRKKDKATGEPRLQIIKSLPLTLKKGAILYPFTENILEYFNTMKKAREDTPLFQIGTRRARQIINGFDPELFPHLLRGSMFTYYMDIIKNPYNVAKMFGVEKVDTFKFYYGGEWEDYKEVLSR